MLSSTALCLNYNAAEKYAGARAHPQALACMNAGGIAQGDCCREMGDAEAAAGAYCESVAYLRRCAAQTPEVGLHQHTCRPWHLMLGVSRGNVSSHTWSCGQMPCHLWAALFAPVRSKVMCFCACCQSLPLFAR